MDVIGPGHRGPAPARPGVPAAGRRDPGTGHVVTLVRVLLLNASHEPLAVVTGRNLKEVAFFVSEKLATIEGIISIAQGENPRNIETKLKGYLHH
jgi:chemotaxis protein MotA